MARANTGSLDNAQPTARELVASNVDALEREVDLFLNLLEQQHMWYGWKNQTGAGFLIPFSVWAMAGHLKRIGENMYQMLFKLKKEEAKGKPRAIYPDRLRAFRTGRPGCPDRVGIFRPAKIIGFGKFAVPEYTGPGIFVGIEMKTGAATQTPEQKYCQQMIEALGGIYVLCRSKEDLYQNIYMPPGVARMRQPVDTSDIPF